MGFNSAFKGLKLQKYFDSSVVIVIAKDLTVR